MTQKDEHNSQKVKRSTAVAKTWENEEIRAKRQTQHSCTVTVNGKTTHHKSVRAGFIAHGLPAGGHIKFRAIAKAQGVHTFEYNGQSFEFKTSVTKLGTMPEPLRDDKSEGQIPDAADFANKPLGSLIGESVEISTGVKTDVKDINAHLTTIYEIMMHAAGHDLFNATDVRSIYTHIMGPKLKTQLRVFTGKVSRAAIADPEAKLVLEHFHRLQHNLTLLVRDHIANGKNASAFIEAVRLMEQVHIVTWHENYAAMSAKGCYEKAGIELVDWSDIPEDVRQNLFKAKLRGAVSNAKQFDC